MEHLLLKMAHQLDGLDEASLMALWDKYAALVSRFEPTKRWEEAALVFCLIQAKHWKNQLFNQSWSAQVRPVSQEESSHPVFTLEQKPKEPERTGQRATVLAFRPRRKEDSPSVAGAEEGKTSGSEKCPETDKD